jgi:hypothetical protein
VPFLRVIRDKRGYETTYLMHWFREGSRQQSRILYAFRSPGGVRVGRGPLEPDVLRQIEARHPEIEFDWPIVLDNRQVIESSPEQRRPQRRRRDDAAPRQAPPARTPQAAPPAATPRFVVPSRLEGETAAAQISFLATWHTAVREQVQQRVQDPARREALLALCERLNTANWTDADEVTAGLAAAGEALERLSHVFAKRRRRSRKKKGPGTDQSPDSTDQDPMSTDQSLDSTDENPDSIKE